MDLHLDHVLEHVLFSRLVYVKLKLPVVHWVVWVLTFNAAGGLQQLMLQVLLVDRRGGDGARGGEHGQQWLGSGPEQLLQRLQRSRHHVVVRVLGVEQQQLVDLKPENRKIQKVFT